MALPENEAARVAALRALNILDTPPDHVFDELVAYAAHALRMHGAALSLVDEQRVWFKAATTPLLTCGPRDASFCTYVVEERQLVEVRDARQDERFLAHDAVTDATGLCFYAGSPVVLKNGHCIGAVYVVDTQPRKLNEEHRLILNSLAQIAAGEIERQYPPA
ncbi:GAF domain-containing protein [Chitinolyticbacter albus]|uniref:GAF domain-containing protein n=1 Tax=Chitinolyticbacter albus TaxID=2961951 RepID=UPI0021090B80|nr:GAF domain-containing protein [Chitinolyticbacter albus]